MTTITTTCPRLLNVGDVVRTSVGMLVLIDHAPVRSTSHNDHDQLGGVYWTHGLVLNAGDLPDFLPVGWLCAGPMRPGDTLADVYEGRWMIQGNDLTSLEVMQTGKTAADFGLA